MSMKIFFVLVIAVEGQLGKQAAEAKLAVQAHQKYLTKLKAEAIANKTRAEAIANQTRAAALKAKEAPKAVSEKANQQITHLTPGTDPAEMVIAAAKSDENKQSKLKPHKISAACKAQVAGIQSKEKAQAVTACEEEAQYPQQAITHLQNDQRAKAIQTIETSFQKCAKFSEFCAKELAPVVIQQLQFSGAAVSDTCRQTVAKVQTDQQEMAKVGMCEKRRKVVENVLASLNKNDVDAAVSSAQVGLEHCMGLSKTCAKQLAPVVVNQIIMRALAEQQQQSGEKEIPTTTVFTKATLAVLANVPKNAEKLSLIEIVDQRVLVHPVFAKQQGTSFLQKVHLPHQFVSRMILQTAQ